MFLMKRSLLSALCVLLPSISFCAGSSGRNDLHANPTKSFARRHPLVTAGVATVSVTSVCVIAALAFYQYTTAKRLKRLQERFDALPINTFITQADQKIAEVRKALAADFEQHRRVLLQEGENVRAEIVRLNAEIQNRQRHLEAIKLLVQSVRDKSGAQFVEELTRVKHEIEVSLASLQGSSSVLNDRMLDMNRNVLVMQARIEEYKGAVSRFDQDIERSRAAQRLIIQTLDDVAIARNTLAGTKREFDELNSEMRNNLVVLKAVAEEVRTDKNQFEAQMQNAQRLLDQTRNRITQFMHEQDARMSEMRASTTQYQTASRNQTSSPLVHSAIDALAAALRPFTTERLEGAPAFERAFAAFCAFHQQRTDTAAIFDAVHRLYNYVATHNYFNAVNVVLPEREYNVLAPLLDKVNAVLSRPKS